MTGPLTRRSVIFTDATSVARESRQYWAAMTSCPSACRVGINLLKHEPSAQSPCTNTMLGLFLERVMCAAPSKIGSVQFADATSNGLESFWPICAIRLYDMLKGEAAMKNIM